MPAMYRSCTSVNGRVDMRKWQLFPSGQEKEASAQGKEASFPAENNFLLPGNTSLRAKKPATESPLAQGGQESPKVLNLSPNPSLKVRACPYTPFSPSLPPRLLGPLSAKSVKKCKNRDESRSDILEKLGITGFYTFVSFTRKSRIVGHSSVF